MACRTLHLPLLKWVRTETGPWAAEHKAKLLQTAVQTENFPAAEWLREQGAVWPKNFQTGMYWLSWTPPMVQYALEHGATWGEWSCQRLSPKVRLAKELLDWAHANGCP
jgi:hypothetical protein